MAFRGVCQKKLGIKNRYNGEPVRIEDLPIRVRINQSDFCVSQIDYSYYF